VLPERFRKTAQPSLDRRRQHACGSCAHFHPAPAVSSAAFLHAARAGSGERGGFMTAE